MFLKWYKSNVKIHSQQSKPKTEIRLANRATILNSITHALNLNLENKHTCNVRVVLKPEIFIVTLSLSIRTSTPISGSSSDTLSV